MRYRSLKGYKYQLHEDERIRVPVLADLDVSHPWIKLHEGVLAIRAGYCWDGASGPTLDTKNSMTPSLAHDALFQLLRAGLISHNRQEDIDYALNQLSRDRGMSKLRRWAWFTGLNFFGGNAAKLRKVEPQDEILEAP